MSEQTAHEALTDFLHRHAAPRLPDLAYVWHTANESAGGAKTRAGVPIDVLKEARMGVVAGVWDWLYIGQNQEPIHDYGRYHFRGLAIELKSSKEYRKVHNGLSPEQLCWRQYYHRNSWYAAVYPEQDWHEAARLLIRWVGGDVNDFRFLGQHTSAHAEYAQACAAAEQELRGR